MSGHLKNTEWQELDKCLAPVDLSRHPCSNADARRPLAMCALYLAQAADVSAQDDCEPTGHEMKGGLQAVFRVVAVPFIK